MLTIDKVNSVGYVCIIITAMFKVNKQKSLNINENQPEKTTESMHNIRNDTNHRENLHRGIVV